MAQCGQTEPELDDDIARRIKERIRAKSMSADEVLMRLEQHARGDMTNFVNLELVGL